MIPKFRAWDKSDNEMILVEDMSWGYYEDDELYFLGIGDSITFWKDTDELEIMQSTGLKDKNSIEIFEGDIIKLSLIEDGDVFISRVDYSLGCLGFYIEGEFLEFHRFITETDVDYVLEIIGNVYENPELLEE